VSDPENPDGAQSAPPDVQALQAVNQYQASMGNTNALSDDPVSKEVGLDIRKQAQKEAALSYGARGGLAKRNYQIMERMKGFETVLDRVFDFRALLIKAPSGLLIEPPIIKESRDAVVVTDAGDEAAVADKVFDINKKAKIVTAPRDWRQYLVQTWAQVPPPPRVLWPKNAKEQAEWDTWVSTGWKAGTEQADQIFEANVNQLTADYNGMVRYKMLLAQDMISAPFTMHEDRGVTGNNGQMRVGDSAIKITGPSQFMTRADLWKPADQ
jgi:defect-in-organelle-trafficking protein DotC